MNPEVILVTVVVLGALGFVVRKAIKSWSGQKGSCRSCGDSCGCALHDAMKNKN